MRGFNAIKFESLRVFNAVKLEFLTVRYIMVFYIEKDSFKSNLACSLILLGIPQQRHVPEKATATIGELRVLNCLVFNTLSCPRL